MSRLPDAARVRLGDANDVQLMVDVEHAAAIHPWSLTQFLASSLRDKDHFLVLEDSCAARLVGFCVFQQVLDEATLLNIAVHPDWQGKGQGAQLMAYLLRELPALGVVRCLLEVRRSNLSGTSLYRRFGFVEDGVRSQYYPTPNGREDALLMSCEVVTE